MTYEILNKKLQVLPPQTQEEVGQCALPFAKLTADNPLEDTGATNELINDGEYVQPLTAEEILALRDSGVHSSVSLSYTSLFLVLIAEH